MVIRGKNRSRYLIPRQWGVPPPPRGTQVVTHVRNLESPFWIGNLRNSEFRCLVPATMFMEWGRSDPQSGKRRQCWFAASDQPIFVCLAVQATLNTWFLHRFSNA